MGFDDIHVHNHKLRELSNVVVYLLQERSMCDTETANDLFCETLRKIDEHLSMVDHLYATLLNQKDEKAHRTAKMFMSGEVELKRIIAEYKKVWFARSRPELRVGNHQQFIKETEELFEIVLSRIEDETEKLYPMLIAS
jgi:hypothetical protein